jgi:hypothetical protein
VSLKPPHPDSPRSGGRGLSHTTRRSRARGTTSASPKTSATICPICSGCLVTR